MHLAGRLDQGLRKLRFGMGDSERVLTAWAYRNLLIDDAAGVHRAAGGPVVIEGLGRGVVAAVPRCGCGPVPPRVAVLNYVSPYPAQRLYRLARTEWGACASELDRVSPGVGGRARRFSPRRGPTRDGATATPAPTPDPHAPAAGS